MPNDRSPVRPLLGARDKIVGGSALDAGARDMTFVSGYSEKRQQIDSELARGREPEIGLTHRFHWVAVVTRNGQPSQKPMSFRAQGYRPVMASEVESLGIERPMASSVTPDGHIRLGDTELFVCSAEQAGINQERARRAIDQQVADDSASDLHRAGRELDRAGDLTTSSTQRRVEITPR